MSTFEVCAILFFPLLILKNHSLFLISNTLVWQINYWLHVKFVCSYDTAVCALLARKCVGNKLRNIICITDSCDSTGM